MIVELILLIAGLVALWFGADITVSGAKKIAKALGINEFIIGLTIVSIGTSLPEIATNVMAGLSRVAGTETSGIALGNVIGSNIANIGLILGIMGIVTVVHITRRGIKRDIIMMFIALLMLFVVSFDGFISQAEGLVLVVVYIAYLLFLAEREQIMKKVTDGKTANPLLDFVFVLIGIVIVIVGGHLVVDNGVAIARSLHMREMLIGIFIGIGTSLPELTVSLNALLKGSKRLALGNILGSNIANPLLALGLGAAISGFSVGVGVLLFDFPYLVAISLVAALVLWRKLDLTRIEGIVLIIMFMVYMGLSIAYF